MRYFEKIAGGSYKIDPLNAYKWLEPQQMLDACGRVSRWAKDALALNLPLQQHVCDSYVFGVYEMTGGTVDDKGRFLYPGDPPQNPVVLFEGGTDKMYQYPNAVIAFVNNETGKAFVTRMD